MEQIINYDCLLDDQDPQNAVVHATHLVAASEELQKCPNLQYVLRNLYQKELERLSNLRLSSEDLNKPTAFLTAHNTQTAKLELLAYVWNLGAKPGNVRMVLEDAVAYRDQVNTQSPDF